MTIKAVIALDLDNGLGRDNNLPWPHNSADLKWFKEQTTDHVVVMGKNTWESLPKKPLPNRYNIVVSNTMKLRNDAEIVRPDILKSRLKTLQNHKPIAIIGGAKLLNSCLDILDELYISRIQSYCNCDTWFLYYQTRFKLVEQHNYHELNLYTEKWIK